MGMLGYRYPACARTGDRAPAKSLAMALCARIFDTPFTAEGMVTVGVMVMVATDAGGPVWINGRRSLWQM